MSSLIRFFLIECIFPCKVSVPLRLILLIHKIKKGIYLLRITTTPTPSLTLTVYHGLFQFNNIGEAFH